MNWFGCFMICMVAGSSKREERISNKYKAARVSMEQTHDSNMNVLEVMKTNLDFTWEEVRNRLGNPSDIQSVYDMVWRHATLPNCMYSHLNETHSIVGVYASCGGTTAGVHPVVLHRWLDFVIANNEEPVREATSVKMTHRQILRMINNWNWAVNEDLSNWPMFQSTVWMLMTDRKDAFVLEELFTMGFVGNVIQVTDLIQNTRRRGKMPMCAHQLIVQFKGISLKEIQSQCPEIAGRITQIDFNNWVTITAGSQVMFTETAAIMTPHQFTQLLNYLIVGKVPNKSENFAKSLFGHVSATEADDFKFIWTYVFGRESYESHMNSVL